MKALSLTQPWAEFVASGLKQWETRGWSTPYRGLLAIHAAKGFPREAREFAEVERALGRVPARIAVGAIVAVVRVAEVRRTEEIAPELSTLERLYGDYTPGRFAWRLTDLVRLDEPIGARGMLGLWTPPPDVVEQLTAALAAPADTTEDET